MSQSSTTQKNADGNGSFWREREERPTRPLDYAVVNVAYGALLGSLLWAARTGRLHAEPLNGIELVATGTATFALSKAVVHEKIETWVREPFVELQPDGDRKPRGRGVRHVIGELLTCSRCMGAWSALAVVGLRVGSPPAGRVVTTVLTATAINDFLQAGFSWTKAKCNIANGQAKAVNPPAPRDKP